MENILLEDERGYSAQKIFLKWGIMGDGVILTSLAHNWSRRHDLASWILKNKDQFNTGNKCSLEEIILEEVDCEPEMPIGSSVTSANIYLFFNKYILQKL